MFTVAKPLPVHWVSLTAVVLSSSRYGVEYDRVKLLHEIGLVQPLPEDETFYIPPMGKSIDTRTAFPDGTIVNFAGQRFRDLQDELQQYFDAVKEGNADKMNELHQLLLATTMLSPVVYKAGTRILTFEYELAVYPKDGTFEIAVWAPMPSFALAERAQVTTSIQLPSSNNLGFRARVVEAEGFQPDEHGNPKVQVPKVLDHEFGLRRIVAWNWQKDPFFRVKYQYI